ncbi:hypothetical protein LOZ58_004843 [Ophidiomyces ophidiicola]|nr:hypothetical protein LOZ65_006269 [Ophidiomyces ophidiicola]KAI1958808.1 hypothetical protein LOZ58_004843 [Ophidiomyces ophidiicola]
MPRAGLSAYFSSSTFLRFPLGAGSNGVLLYVIVRVTTWRTVTGRAQEEHREASRYRMQVSAVDSPVGDNIARKEALRGDSAIGEAFADFGVRTERRLIGVLGVFWYSGRDLVTAADDGVCRGGDLRWASQLQKYELVGGFEDAADREEDLSVEDMLDDRGLAIIGVRVFRNSVYATGGVIGVFRESSFLIKSILAENSGLSCSSDGNTSDLEVSSGAKVGFDATGILGRVGLRISNSRTVQLNSTKNKTVRYTEAVLAEDEVNSNVCMRQIVQLCLKQEWTRGTVVSGVDT